MTATIDALIPVRALATAKKRLGPALAPEERRALAQAMLEDVLHAATTAPRLRQIWVVTGDADAAAIAQRYGARIVPEHRPATGSPLNAALEEGRRVLAAHNPPDALLVLPMDLPAITSETLSEFLRVVDDVPGPLVAICPARDGGTNALLLRPPALIPFLFGRGSARKHARAAEQAGAAVAIRPFPALALDLDTPEDIRRLLTADAGWSRAAATLRTLGIAERLSGA